MKKITFALSFAIAFCSYTLTAQQVGERGISTNPANPSNPDINSPIISNPNGPGPVLNNFYWFNTNANGPYNHYEFTINHANNNPQTTIGNPFFDTYYPDFGKTFNDVPYRDSSDYLPQDGWELIKVDLGRRADDITPRPLTLIGNISYVALYNRYSGIMRFMGTIPKNFTDAKQIKFNVNILRNDELAAHSSDFIDNTTSLSLNGQRANYAYQDLKVTNLLSLNDMAMQPLDQPTKMVATSVITQFPGLSSQEYMFWFDMPFAYDPCVCKGKLFLALSYEQIETWTFNADGTLLANYDVNAGVEANNCSNELPKQIIGGIIATASTISSAGSTAFASAGGFAGLLKAAGCIAGLSVEDQKVIGALTEVVESSANVIDSYNKIYNTNHSDKKYTYDAFKSEFYSSNAFGAVNKKEIADFLSKSSKFMTSSYDLTTVGKAKSVKDAGGVQRNTQNIKGTIELTGTITNPTENDKDILWALPGSSWGANTLQEYPIPSGIGGKMHPEYPLYNEALGTLAFLKTPKVSNLIKSVRIETIKSQTNSQNFSVFDRAKYHTYWLDEDLKFFFNPKTHVDLNKTVILAGYEWIGGDGKKENTKLVSVHDFRELHPTFKEFNPTQAPQLFIKIFIQFFSKDLNSKDNQNSNIQFFTIPVSVNTLQTFNVHSITQNSFHNGNGVFDEPLDFATEQSFHPNYPLVQTLVATAPSTSVVISNPITASQDQVIFSEDDIIIQANLKSINGAKLYIRSKKSIRVNPGVIVDDNVFLEIYDEVYIGKWPQSPVTLDLVQAFCDKKAPEGLNYVADRFENKGIQSDLMNENAFDQSSIVKIYPNPAQDKLYLKHDKLNSMTRIELLDLSGRVIQHWNQYNNYLELNNVANGTYFLKVYFEDSQKVETHKLGIQK